MLNRIPKEDPYKERYKGIYFCIVTVYRMLQGSYCNYGIFDLYNDPTLSDVMNVVAKMAASIPLAELMVHQSCFFQQKQL